MHSGFEIPAGIQQQQQHNVMGAENNSASPILLSAMNQPHILEQIHTSQLTSTTQQLFFDQQHFLPPNHHYTASVAPSSAFYPVNFKLGLNNSTNNNDNNSSNKDGTGSTSVINDINEGAFLHGSEQYDVPEARVGLPHCWQNQQDSSIKPPPQPSFWEPLPAEVSNENSEIVNTRENLEMNNKESVRNCFDSTKSRILFGELEAIYKRFGTTESINQADTNEYLPGVTEASIGEEAPASASLKKRKKKRKEKTQKSDCDEEVMINSTARFFERLVKQVMEHQDNLHRKFAEVVERLDLDRREREEAWRNQESAYFEQEAADRLREKALAMSREATIVEYLEKITGEKVNLPPYNPNA